MHWKCTTKYIFSVHACDVITRRCTHHQSSLAIWVDHWVESSSISACLPGVCLQVHALWGHGLETMDPVAGYPPDLLCDRDGMVLHGT